MGVAFCLVNGEVKDRLEARPDFTVDTMTFDGSDLFHVRVEGESVPNTGSWCKQVVIDGDKIGFKDDVDT